MTPYKSMAKIMVNIKKEIKFHMHNFKNIYLNMFQVISTFIIKLFLRCGV